MSSLFEFVAEKRDQSGKSAASRVRRQGKVPAIIYGGGGKSEMLLLGHNDVLKHLDHEAVYSHILDIKIDGKTEQVVLKDIHRHPSKLQIMHLDFLRVSKNEKIRVKVPLHCINEDISLGVKEGGVVMHSMVDIEVSCLPADLPEFIEIDLAKVELGESVHLHDIKMPKGAECVILSQAGDHNLPVVSIAAAKVVVEVEAEDTPVEGSEGLSDSEAE